MSARKYFREVFLHDDSKRTNKGRFLFSFVLEPIEVLYADNLQTLVLDAHVHKFGVTTAKNIHVVVKEEEFFAKKFTLMKVTYRDGPMTPSMIFVRIVGVDWYLIDAEREESITSDSSHALQMLASEYLHTSKPQQQMILST